MFSRVVEAASSREYGFSRRKSGKRLAAAFGYALDAKQRQCDAVFPNLKEPSLLSFLPATVLGVITSTLLVLNLVLWMTLFFVVALLKLLAPVKAWRRAMLTPLAWLATHWIDGNRLVANLHDLEWRVTGVDGLRPDAWYLVISNHQSWVDIFVLQTVFNHRIPFLKFFIKRELIWVPLLGFAWWALEMPFMRRHSREALAANPALREQDLAATRKLCEGIRHRPSTIMNFVEGTRFTPEKHAARKSPYEHLLRPKTGGLGLIFATLGDTLTSVLDVTIVYPHERVSFWQLLSGRIDTITVDVRERPIPNTLRTVADPTEAGYRAELRAWIDDIWDEKDRVIDSLRSH